MKCKVCGKDLPEDSLFCEKCEAVKSKEENVSEEIQEDIEIKAEDNVSPHQHLLETFSEKNKKYNEKKFILILAGILLILIVAIVLTLVNIFKDKPKNNPQKPEKAVTYKENTKENTFVYAENVASLYNLEADFFDIPIKEETNVTFSVHLESKEKSGDEHLGIYTIGKNELICELNDNGENGDKKAGDGIYSGQQNLYSDKVKVTQYIARGESDAISSSNSVDICFYKEITDQEFEEFEKITEPIWNMEYDEVKKYVRSIEGAEFNINNKNHSVSFKTACGITCVWEDYKINPVSSADKSSDADYKRISKNLDTDLAPAITKTDIAVIRPFKNSDYNYNDFSETGNILKTALSGNVNTVDDNAVTLEFMKSLENYGVILIDSHGTLINGEIPHIVLGENYSRNASLSADFQSERICIVNNKYTVGGSFFNKYYEDSDFNESLWFLGCCYGSYDKYIKNILINKGAGAVLGFDDRVSGQYKNEILYDFMVNGLIISGNTTGESLEKATNNYGENDPNNLDSSSPVLTGNKNYRLIKNEEIIIESPIEEQSTPTKTSEKNYMWLIVLIITILVIVSGLVFNFIILPKYKKMKEDSPDSKDIK